MHWQTLLTRTQCENVKAKRQVRQIFGGLKILNFNINGSFQKMIFFLWEGGLFRKMIFFWGGGGCGWMKILGSSQTGLFQVDHSVQDGIFFFGGGGVEGLLTFLFFGGMPDVADIFLG